MLLFVFIVLNCYCLLIDDINNFEDYQWAKPLKDNISYYIYIYEPATSGGFAT